MDENSFYVFDATKSAQLTKFRHRKMIRAINNSIGSVSLFKTAYYEFPYWAYPELRHTLPLKLVFPSDIELPEELNNYIYSMTHVPVNVYKSLSEEKIFPKISYESYYYITPKGTIKINEDDKVYIYNITIDQLARIADFVVKNKTRSFFSVSFSWCPSKSVTENLEELKKYI